MKNYLIRLKRELFFFLFLGLIAGVIISFIYLRYSPILYTTSAQLTFSEIGKEIFKETGFADEPEKVFRNEKLSFLSERQKQDIEFDVSADYKSLSIKVKAEDDFKIFRIANSIAESYKAEIDKAGAVFAEKRYREELEKINQQQNKYTEQAHKVSAQLNELEPKLEALQRQQESVEVLRSSLKERIANLEIRKSGLLRVYTESHPEVIGINFELDSLKRKMEDLPVIEGIETLKRDILQRKAEYSELQKKMTELNTQKESLFKGRRGPFLTISGYATKPQRPIGDLSAQDIYKRAILSGLLIGIIISLVVAGVKDTIVSEFEVSNIQDLPLIATVPFVKPTKAQKLKASRSGRKPPSRQLLFSYDDSSEYINAYRGLAMHIKLDAFKGNIDKRVIIVTSPRSKMGKSTVGANLSIILARLGKSVVLLDANLNRRSVAKFFGIGAREPGISDILSDKANLEDCLKGVTDMLLAGIDWTIAMRTYGLDRLKVLPSGRKVVDPAGLLESKATSELFGQLREQFDCIVVDSPSLLRSPDSIILSQNADGIFLVCRTYSTSYKDLIRCKRKLEKLQIEAKGSILVCT